MLKTTIINTIVLFVIIFFCQGTAKASTVVNPELESYLKNIKKIAIAELQEKMELNLEAKGEEKENQERKIIGQMLEILKSASRYEISPLLDKAIKRVEEKQSYLKIPTYVDWVHFNDAIEKSKAEKKLVLIEIYTNLCRHCEKLDKNVYNDPKIARKINANFVPVKIDAEDSVSGIFYHGKQITPSELARSLDSLNAKDYPSTFFLSSEGKRVGFHNGYMRKKKYDKVLDSYLNDGHKKQE